MIWLLAGAIGLVFIIASANVANLFLARSAARRRELTIRLALGGTRGHLFRHTLAESLLLCLAAAVIGLALASIALQTLVALAPISTPRFNAVRLDGVSVAAALVAAIVAAVSFAAFATLRSETEEAGGLRQQAPTASRRQHRMRNVLVVTQVALALELATGAALMRAVSSTSCRSHLDSTPTVWRWSRSCCRACDTPRRLRWPRITARWLRGSPAIRAWRSKCRLDDAA